MEDSVFDFLTPLTQTSARHFFPSFLHVAMLCSKPCSRKVVKRNQKKLEKVGESKNRCPRNQGQMVDCAGTSWIML